MAYLYNFVNKPHKTQEKVRQIMTELYANEPDGISGNEDCGQMSAWYVFSALGFYPVTPGSNEYIIGSPIVKSATINLENGNTFRINAPENNRRSYYVNDVTLNGEKLEQSYINHNDIVNGGVLDFSMSRRKAEWGSTDASIPSTEINEFLITSPPYVSIGDLAFDLSTTVELESIQDEADIYYSTGGDYEKYTEPLTIDDNTIIKVYADINGQKSAVLETTFREKNPDVKVTLHTDYHYQYTAGGNDALADGIIGGEDFRTGAWQGYHDVDVNAIVNLSAPKTIHDITINFLSDQSAWIFFPDSAECYVSVDGENYTFVGSKDFNNEELDSPKLNTISFTPADEQYQYVKLIAKKIGPVPEWHMGHQYDGKPGSLSMKFKLIMNQSNRIIDNIQAGFVALFIFVLSSCQTATNTLSLPSLFSDNMVLQRNADVQLWGKSFAGAEVTIAVPWGEFKSEANNDGSWDIVMPTADYDRPFSMEVCDDTSCINIQNVVLGEVWLASGQSNMSMPLKGWLPTDPIENSSAEIAQSDQYPFRFLKSNKQLVMFPKPQYKEVGR